MIELTEKECCIVIDALNKHKNRLLESENYEIDVIIQKLQAQMNYLDALKTNGVEVL